MGILSEEAVRSVWLTCQEYALEVLAEAPTWMIRLQASGKDENTLLLCRYD